VAKVGVMLILAATNFFEIVFGSVKIICNNPQSYYLKSDKGSTKHISHFGLDIETMKNGINFQAKNYISAKCRRGSAGI
jgi:hypothetical protein